MEASRGEDGEIISGSETYIISFVWCYVVLYGVTDLM
jgi:hypothetical protein